MMAVVMATPTKIGICPKNSREEIRVSLEMYNGRPICNIRVYFRSEEGEMLPSRKGLALSVDRLEGLVEVLNRALLVVSPTWRPAARKGGAERGRADPTCLAQTRRNRLP